MSIARVLRASRLLAMAKSIDEVRLIMIGEVFLHFVNRTLVLQLRIPFKEYLASHQFRVVSRPSFDDSAAEAFPQG